MDCSSVSSRPSRPGGALSSRLARACAGVVLVVVICLTVAVAAATAGMRTTAPGVTAHVPIVLMSASIEIPKDQFAQKAHPNLARFPRGATIIFNIQNKGGRAATLVLRLTSKISFYGASKLKKEIRTGIVAPGKTAHLTGTFVFRGLFLFELVVDGKIVATHPMAIF
jgi:hypothetical protein